MSELIIDSAMSREEIFAQNPLSPAPDGVLKMLEIVLVSYVGFDGEKHRGQIVMHRAVVDDVKEFFARALVLSFPVEKVIPISTEKYAWNDAASCEDNNSSGYNYRTIFGTEQLSYHARGLAFDINPVQNVYVRYDAEGNETYRLPRNGAYDERASGTLTQHHPLVLFMRDRGWTWGGDWKKEGGRTDYQHFEKIV